MKIDTKVWTGKPAMAFEVKKALEKRFGYPFLLEAVSEDRYMVKVDLSRGSADLLTYSDELHGIVKFHARHVAGETEKGELP